MQILVLGMHRSGTSMVARLLNMMGAYFAPEGVEMPAYPENPKGFWERQGVLLCIRLLRSANCEWYRISSFTVDKIPNEALEEFREQGRKEFSESQKEVHKVNAKISQQAADVARYQRRLENCGSCYLRQEDYWNGHSPHLAGASAALCSFAPASLAANRILAGGSGSWVNLKRGSSSVASIQLLTQQKIRASPNCKAVSSAGEQMTQMIDPQTKRYTALAKIEAGNCTSHGSE